VGREFIDESLVERFTERLLLLVPKNAGNIRGAFWAGPGSGNKAAMYAKRIDEPTEVVLSEYPTDADGGLTKDQAAEKLAALTEELAELQELCYGAGQNAVLVVLQGRDTSARTARSKRSPGP
jgi:hypothetical protein